MVPQKLDNRNIQRSKKQKIRRDWKNSRCIMPTKSYDCNDRWKRVYQHSLVYFYFFILLLSVFVVVIVVKKKYHRNTVERSERTLRSAFAYVCGFSSNARKRFGYSSSSSTSSRSSVCTRRACIWMVVFPFLPFRNPSEVGCVCNRSLA